MVLIDVSVAVASKVANFAKPGVCGDTEYDCSVALPVKLAIAPKPLDACSVPEALINAAGNVEYVKAVVAVALPLIFDSPTNAHELLTVPEPDMDDDPTLDMADVSVELALIPEEPTRELLAERVPIPLIAEETFVADTTVPVPDNVLDVESALV
jgi:hypothetical protein